ncbi:MAG: DUF4301 family protein [Tannerella sp.]|jgi:hypothetical protein|nr:DUF4301 family protein [Tannerella sp.]
MLTKSDLLQLKTKRLTVEQIDEQLGFFIKGFPFADIKASASVEKGIMRISENEQDDYIQQWEEYLSAGKGRVVKFVPASGAASRMFKDLFAFVEADSDSLGNDFLKTFFDKIENFAFYGELKQLGAGQNYKDTVRLLLNADGLNYGSLPKGLLLFHNYDIAPRTAVEEHLVEGALYAAGADNIVRLHFTVSPEHQALFEKHVAEKSPLYAEKYGVGYDLSFSVQQSNTDTVAVDMANAPFRDAKGKLVFRPGGHGALIHNLNKIDADVVFIKNIDNVSPDSRKAPTVRWKKVIAGVLITVQQQIFDYIRLLDGGNYTHQQIGDIIHFLHDDLCIRNPETKFLEDAELVIYLKRKLNRPLRVCGMVRNAGEPGGGPFFSVAPDGVIQLQILESSQIDMTDEIARAAFEKGTHFNPVDLVCSLKDAYGKPFNLPDFVDKNTGFISRKSKDGRDLKALELPGLWNGAMADWNTIFVEVPLETFNPVKTVNDLRVES